MSDEPKIEPYLHTSLIRDRIPEPLLDLLGDLHWGKDEPATPAAAEKSQDVRHTSQDNKAG